MPEIFYLLAVLTVALGGLSLLTRTRPDTEVAGSHSAAAEPARPPRLRVITLTHAMLDPGMAYWFTGDEVNDV
ncbi:hypothetical protein AB0L82_18460 [Nocardia sp. NPDC052001]|uniref:hypothetical protein n=1 Tax=unclassified Nocardia TaxID=2637762 RepID=UPI00342BA321